MEMNEYILQRIAAMVAAFDRTAGAVKALEAALDAYQTAKVDIDRLTDYLDSGAWREDFEADEAGLVPGELKRGVLSEDAHRPFANNGVKSVVSRVRQLPCLYRHR